MQYGYFDDAAGEYVVTRPDTPRPWSNYIGSADFGGIITNNAAGYTFYRSAAQGRLTRYQFNALPAQQPGRFLYLRDGESGDFWSNSWMPVWKDPDGCVFECRHGLGYTTIRSLSYAKIESEVTYFAPPGALYEVWRVRVRNADSMGRILSLFPFVEPQCNWSADDDTRNLQYNQYIVHTECVDGILDFGSNVNMPEDPEHFTNKDQARHTFFGLAGIEPDGFDGDLARFMSPWGSYARPEAVVEGRCRGSSAVGDMPCGAFQVDLRLAAGEEVEFACVFGVGTAREEGRAAVRDMGNAEQRESALQAVKDHWHGRIATLHVETPDAAFNSMVNVWAPYNNLMTFYWSRTASLVYAGERDGLGFRDTLQDFVGASGLITEEVRERLELMLTGQYAHGGCKPVVQPFNHRPGSEAEPDHLRADDGMWFFQAVPTFVKETGDTAFYRKVLPFADTGEATVLGHLRRAIEFNLERSGVHGLPCGLFADWNDCIRLGEKGETVFVAMQLRFALKEYVDIASFLAESAEAEWAAKQLAGLDERLETHAWDGDWYLRAFRYDGQKFGSKDCEEGKIFMNPQTWAVLSGVATGERAEQVMESMHEHLDTEYGIMLCTPPYVRTDPEVCLGRLMDPGMKENGGIFNHTQGWAVMAAAELGWGDRAFAYLRNILPARFNEIAEIREVEPYAVCQSTHSCFSPRYGAGRVSWLSGSAVWNYVAMTGAILGIKPEYDGLRIDPCIPSAWDGFSVTRRFRGATYRIRLENPAGRCRGVVSLEVDGHRTEGNLVPPAAANSTVEVVAWLG
ncbi:MAG: N,N'-diacetylchitobiose phosphorylase [Verrucomicrobia bacterium]|jgi:cellobiose phosphorylase|nr:N,N'-diacetylchitobiose phosphorylase [Verrucomicrobiota bacterium]